MQKKIPYIKVTLKMEIKYENHAFSLAVTEHNVKI